MVLYTITQGWTKRLTFYAQADGAAVALPTNTSIVLKDRDGSTINVSDRTTLPDQSASPGQVHFDPAGGDFLAALSPYSVHVVAVDSDSRQVSFPNGAADHIVVKPL